MILFFHMPMKLIQKYKIKSQFKWKLSLNQQDCEHFVCDFILKFHWEDIRIFVGFSCMFVWVHELLCVHLCMKVNMSMWVCACVCVCDKYESLFSCILSTFDSNKYHLQMCSFFERRNFTVYLKTCIKIIKIWRD